MLSKPLKLSYEIEVELLIEQSFYWTIVWFQQKDQGKFSAYDCSKSILHYMVVSPQTPPQV